MSFGSDRDASDGFRDPLGGLRAAVDALLEQEPAELVLAEKGADLVRLRHQIDRLEAAFAARALDCNRNGVGLEDGHHSTATWVAWKTGMERPAGASL